MATEICPAGAQHGASPAETIFSTYGVNRLPVRPALAAPADREAVSQTSAVQMFTLHQIVCFGTVYMFIIISKTIIILDKLFGFS